MGLNPTIHRLRLRNYVQPPQVLHVARALYRTGEAFPDHTHDFAEIFWIESGRGHHAINGARDRLEQGDVVVMRPEDRHSFSAGASGMVLVNIAFAAELLPYLRSRYFEDSDSWPWQGSALPARFRVEAGGLALLGQWADALAAHRESRLELERTLLNLLAMTRPLAAGQADRWALMQAPTWLAQAVCAMQEGQGLEEGVAELARRAGRTPAHVNRVTRRCLGRTATQLINELRLDHASRQLRMTQQPIADVALACGWSNLTHFYRLFKQRFGQTPRRFRVREQMLAGRAAAR